MRVEIARIEKDYTTLKPHRDRRRRAPRLRLGSTFRHTKSHKRGTRACARVTTTWDHT